MSFPSLLFLASQLTEVPCSDSGVYLVPLSSSISTRGPQPCRPFQFTSDPSNRSKSSQQSPDPNFLDPSPRLSHFFFPTDRPFLRGLLQRVFDESGTLVLSRDSFSLTGRPRVVQERFEYLWETERVFGQLGCGREDLGSRR